MLIRIVIHYHIIYSSRAINFILVSSTWTGHRMQLNFTSFQSFFFPILIQTNNFPGILSCSLNVLHKSLFISKVSLNQSIQVKLVPLQRQVRGQVTILKYTENDKIRLTSGGNAPFLTLLNNHTGVMVSPNCISEKRELLPTF